MKRLTFDDPKKCSGCGACVASCPKHCLSLAKNDLGFTVIAPNALERCIDCGLCTKVCPQFHERAIEKQNSQAVFGQIKNEEHLYQSSSGGFFSLLASHVIRIGGFVWGVEITSNGNAQFLCINNLDDLWKLRGSKYTEVVNPLDFMLIKQQLKEGHLVLVSGTPCQILALRKYLGKTDYPQLILVDLLCYGIQSPKMWSLYLKDVNPHNKPIQSVSMRNKRFSWFNYSMAIQYADGTSYKKIRYRDPWLLTYSTSLFNRMSCSACQSKKSPHVSDFTIGDFWHIDYYKSPIKLDKKKGVSLAIIHTKKATRIFDEIKPDFIYGNLPQEYLHKLDSSFSVSSKINPLRDEFIQYAFTYGFGKSCKKYISSGIKVWYKKRKNYLRYRTIDRLKAIIKKIIRH